MSLPSESKENRREKIQKKALQSSSLSPSLFLLCFLFSDGRDKATRIQ